MKGCFAPTALPNVRATALALTISLTLACGYAGAQTHSSTCKALDQAESTEAALKQRLSCYNAELDDLSSLIGKLLKEREQLSVLLDGDTGAALANADTDNQLLKDQLETIEQLRLERSDLSAQLHRELIEKQEQLLSREAEERLLRNYSQAYLAIADENTELVARIKELNDEIAALKLARNTLTDNNTSLNSNIEQQRATIVDLTSQRTRLSHDLEASAALSEDIKSQLVTYTVLTQQQAKTIKTLQADKQATAVGLQDLQQNKKQLLAQIQTLEQQVADLNNKQTDLDQNNNSLTSQIGTYKATVADLSARKTRLTKELDRSTSLSKKLKRQLHNKINKVQDQSATITALHQQLQSNKATIDQSYNDLADAKKSHATELQQIDTRIRQLTAELDSLKSTNARLSADAEQAAIEADNTLQQKQQEIAALNREIQGLTDERIAVTTQLEDADSLLAEKKDIIASLSSQVSSQEDDYQSLQQTLSSTESALTHSKDELALLTQNNDELKARIASLEQLTADKQTNIAQLKTEGTAAAESIAQLNAEKNTLLEDLSALQTQHDQLSAQLSTAQQETQQLTESSEASSSEIASLTSDIAGLQDELTATKNALTAADQALNDKQDALIALQDKKADSDQQVAALNAKVATLESLLNESQSNTDSIGRALAAIKAELDDSNQRTAAQQSELQQLLSEKDSIIGELTKVRNETQSLADAIQQDLANSDIQVDVDADNAIGMKIASSQLFRTGSSALTNDGKALLGEVAATLQKLSTRRILIEGHSDNVPLGDKLSRIFTDNMGLSLARATSAAQFFTREAGLPAQQLSITGAGDTRPLASNDTAEGRQQNRRVEIMLLPLDAAD